ncbi:hypothetical protein EDD86DRAFT_200131 [Gorgonomyces haynaldii]|nr:hypothetical protein EDD86DRAFT_200131 [Gorgonomyces haynaldii]
MIERLVAVHADPKLQEEYRSFSPEIGNISDFFPLFKFIYKLTQKPEYVVLMTQMVLDFFESDGCVYLELRSTPRSTPGMSKRDYVLAIMEGIKQFKGRMIVQYIASLDRRNSLEENLDTVHLAHQLLQEGYPVCGVDLCGDPEKGVFRETMLPALQLARQLGLKLTVHCAEIQGVGQETMEILELKPDRIGHGTFLDEVSRQYLVDCSIPVEICMTSNVMCKTVKDYEDHHFYDLHYEGHPLILCVLQLMLDG